jgi:hypothetical protein
VVPPVERVETEADTMVSVVVVEEDEAETEAETVSESQENNDLVDSMTGN